MTIIRIHAAARARSHGRSQRQSIADGASVRPHEDIICALPEVRRRQARIALEPARCQHHLRSPDFEVVGRAGTRAIGWLAADDSPDNAGARHTGMLLEQLGDRRVGEDVRTSVAIPDAALVVLVEVRDVDREADSLRG